VDKSGVTTTPAAGEPSVAAAGVDRSTIVAAFLRKPLSASEERLVRALLDTTPATPAALSFAMGWKGANAWQLHFGALCRRREHLLGPAPLTTMRRTKDGRPAQFYTGLLADWCEESHSFQIRPEARAAFADLGLDVSREAL
jgi:hypothetical protein